MPSTMELLGLAHTEWPLTAGLFIAGTLWWICGRPVDSWFLLAAFAVQSLAVRACWYLADNGVSFGRWRYDLCCPHCAEICDHCYVGLYDDSDDDDEDSDGEDNEWYQCHQDDDDAEGNERASCVFAKALHWRRWRRALRSWLSRFLLDYVRLCALFVTTLTGGAVHRVVGTVGLAIWLEIGWQWMRSVFSE